MEAAALVAAVRPLMPPQPPGAPGPFALSDEVALRRFAADAGLTPVEVFDAHSPFVYADEATATRGLNSSGVAARAKRTGRDRGACQSDRPFRQPDGSYRIKAFRCLLAQP